MHNFRFCLAQQPNAGQGCLVLEVFRSYISDTPQSVRLLWTRDRLVADLYLATLNTHDRHPCPQAGFFSVLSVFYPYFFVLIVLASAFHRYCKNKHNKLPCPPGGIRTRNPSKRAAADIRLRPLGRWDRHNFCLGL